MQSTPWDPMTLATVCYVLLTLFVVVFMGWQTHLQRRLFKMQVFFMVLGRLEQGRADRKTLREWIKGKGAGAAALPIPPDDEAAATAADNICREYDILGLLERRRFLDKRLVDEFYSVPLAILWRDYLARYVDDLRQTGKRGPTHFWELAQFAERVRWVPDNHPGYTLGRKSWPWGRRGEPRRPTTG